MLRRGLAPFTLRHGLGATRRLLWLKSKYDALEADLANHQPHWYVHMMAIPPERQGRGLGTELIHRALDIALSGSGADKIVLTTHVLRNVVFYGRVGFDTAWERTVRPPRGTPYSVWGMSRRNG
jgi:GNAT superfamily N-acetyltransferase